MSNISCNYTIYLLTSCSSSPRAVGMFFGRTYASLNQKRRVHIHITRVLFWMMPIFEVKPHHTHSYIILFFFFFFFFLGGGGCTRIILSQCSTNIYGYILQYTAQLGKKQGEVSFCSEAANKRGVKQRPTTFLL